MANSIAKFKKYVPYLNEVYAESSKTAILETNSALVKEGTNANEILIPKMSMSGLGDYSRDNGYVDGSATLDYQTIKFDYDRGRSFNIDAMDDEETAGVAFGSLASEFIRSKVVPEIDAYRFATYAANANYKHWFKPAEKNGDKLIEGITAAATSLDELSAPYEGRYLFITPTDLNTIMQLDSYKSKTILDTFEDVIRVPQSRFYSAIDMLDGASGGEEAGGYKPTPVTYKPLSTQPDDWNSNYGNYYVKDSSDENKFKANTSSTFNANQVYERTGAYNLDFMIIPKSSVFQYTKHTVNKVISPDDNQTSDAWKFFYRVYGVADKLDKKAIAMGYTLDNMQV